ncbi:unnamed protein product [Paramecium octaurelia]|uniref:Uncharacterized protein n=1 Tax=Paramecium octaurelia TaxID=43137 RepID=A0A8S1Y4F5_PAROT|nr:unnamed protein product [Paramecium octaurelia]
MRHLKRNKKICYIKNTKNEQIIELLKFLVYLTAIDEGYVVGGSNSLNLLVEMQVDLTNQKMRIKNTSLAEGNLQNVIQAYLNLIM